MSWLKDMLRTVTALFVTGRQVMWWVLIPWGTWLVASLLIAGYWWQLMIGVSLTWVTIGAWDELAKERAHTRYVEAVKVQRNGD